MDRFNIFTENMMICIEGSYFEPEAIERAKTLSRTESARWVVHDNTGEPHYVAARGEIYMVGSTKDEVYRNFIQSNQYMKERLDHFSNEAIEATLILGKTKMMLDGLWWELQNHNPDILRLRQIVDQLLPPEIRPNNDQ